MTKFRKCFDVKKGDFICAGEASINIQNLLKSMNMDKGITRRIAICGYEGEMNAVMHGGDGTLCIEIDSDCITLEVEDHGPGIADTELAMQEGFSTASDEYREMGFGAGMGLPNMNKNSDELTIESVLGKGTVIRMLFHLEPQGS